MAPVGSSWLLVRLYNVTACATFGSVSWDTTGVVGLNRHSLAPTCSYRLVYLADMRKRPASSQVTQALIAKKPHVVLSAGVV